MPTERPRTTIATLRRKKDRGEKIVMLSAYDALFAAIIESVGLDIILVGDSVNTVLCGEESTHSATMDQMVYHTRIVRRGAPNTFVVFDMPFMSYQVTVEEAVHNAGRGIKETGANAVKIEGGSPRIATVQAIVDAGIAVMAHLGFTPQSVDQLGGYRVQGRGDSGNKLIADAKRLEDAGAFALVLELVPTDVAARVTDALSIPTIGIGSGIACDGQVLVLHDLLGLNEEFQPRFLKRYASLADDVRAALTEFANEVRSGTFPDDAHSYE